MRARFAGMVAALVLAGACVDEVTIDVPGSATVMIGVPVAGADSVFVMLGTSLPGSAAAPISGAQVEMSIGAVTVSLDEGPVGACGVLGDYACYRARTDGLVRPGDSILARARLSSGEEIRGRAMVPPVPELGARGFEGSDTIRGLSLGPSGPRPSLVGHRGAPGAIMAADSTSLATVWVGEEVLHCAVTAGPIPGVDLRSFGAVVAFRGGGCPEIADLAWDSLAAPVTFLLYDDNFTRWLGAGHLGATTQPFGVEGAWGVFGAATPRTLVLMAVPEGALGSTPPKP